MNPALIVADILETYLGVPRSNIDQDALILAANICDEPTAKKDLTKELRYTANGTFKLNGTWEDYLTPFINAMAGAVIEWGGVYYISAGSWTEPVVEITDADLMGPEVSFTRSTGDDAMSVYSKPALRAMIRTGSSGHYRFTATTIPSGSHIILKSNRLSDASGAYILGEWGTQNGLAMSGGNWIGAGSLTLSTVTVNGVDTAAQPIGQRSVLVATTSSAFTPSAFIRYFQSRFFLGDIEALYVLPPSVTRSEAEQLGALLQDDI